MKIKKNLYIKILKWAYNKVHFTERELYNKFPKLKTKLKEFYLNTFRGAKDNDNCLIGVYDDKKGSFYLSLTAKGRSEYLRIKKKWWEKIIIGVIAGVIVGVIILLINFLI